MHDRSHKAKTSDLLQEALLRGKRRAVAWFRRSLAAVRPPKISDQDFNRALKADAINAPLEYFAAPSSCGAFAGLRRLRESAAACKQAHPHTAASIIDGAERILTGKYPIFGEWISLGRDPDWHVDWTTGYRWPFAHHTRLSWTDSKDRAEVKLVWELGKLSHVLTLFLAFALTSEDRYAAEALRQIEHFEESNPLEFGVNWLSPTQVSLRLINLSLIAWFLPLSAPFGNGQFRDFLRLVLGHVRHVRRNLEFSHLATSNHYFSNITALLVAGQTFPHFVESDEWREFGAREFARELGKQIHRDGSHYESSFGYHRLVTELALLSFGLLSNGQQANLLPAETIRKMVDFMRKCRMPTGELPHIGDSDDTRVLCFVPECSERAEIDALLQIGSRLIGQPGFSNDARPSATELFLCGPRASSDNRFPRPTEETNESQMDFSHASRITHHASLTESAAFPHAAIYVQRHGDLFAIIDAGGNGIYGRGSHAHNDVLSFELSAGRTAFLIDAGTYLYTGSEKWRNAFRSTAWHNTVVVDGEEQNRIFPARLFELGEDARVTVREWKSNADEDVFDAQHSGYERLPQPVTHRRSLVLDKRGKLWRLTDRLTGTGRHVLSFVFHFAPDCRATIQPDRSIVAHGAESSLHLIPLGALQLEVKLEERWVSRRFGTKTPSHAAVFTLETEMPVEVEFMLVPSTSHSRPDRAVLTPPSR